MDPINYSIDVQNPFQAALQGFQGGAGVRQVLDQRAVLEQQRAQQLQMQQDLKGLIGNQNAGVREYAAMTVKYPQLREQFKQASDMLSSERGKGEMDVASRAYSAILSGRTDIAESLMRDRAEAMRNSGAPERDVKAQEMWADLIKESPEQARHIGGLMLSSVMGPDKFADTFGKLGSEQRNAEQAPAELERKRAEAAKAKSDAETAAVKAKFAGSEAIADLEKKGWDIKKIAEDIDIAKQNNRIAAMNAQTSRINSDTQRQELSLKIEEAKTKRDATIREKVATAEAGSNSIDNMLNTIERVKKNPALNSVLGALEGGRFYPQTLAGMLPGTASADDRADAMALIETLGSQAFVAQIPNIKGTGALSDAEGKKLQSALQNLSREQSEKQFRENLDEAARLLTKGREGLSRATGVPLGKPDTPAAPGTRPPLSSFNK